MTTTVATLAATDEAGRVYGAAAKALKDNESATADLYAKRKAFIASELAPYREALRKAEVEAERQAGQDFDPNIRDLESKRYDLVVAKETAATAYAAAVAAEHFYPVGTKVQRSTAKRGGYSWRQPSKTVEYGIVEAFKRGDDYADNMSRYGAPEPGHVIVRLLKKDGTPGKKVEVISRRYGDLATNVDWFEHVKKTGWKPVEGA